jgi:hypothetical protein
MSRELTSSWYQQLERCRLAVASRFEADRDPHELQGVVEGRQVDPLLHLYASRDYRSFFCLG